MNRHLLVCWVIAVALVLGLAGGTVFGVSTTVDNAVKVDAERRAHDWARFMTTELPGLPLLLDGQEPDADQRMIIRGITRIGDVFRFKLFNADADVVVVADRLGTSLEPGTSADHNGNAASVLATGKPAVLIGDGSGETDLPRVYAEAYLAISDQDGRRIGVAEVYMDQTAVYDLFHSMFDMLSFVLAGAYAVAIVAGFAAFMAKQNQAMRSRDRADFLAHYDPTSGVLNRSGFTSEAKRLLGQNADPYADVATICVDIDRFKELNDTFGYRSGDAFLQHVGKALSAAAGPEGVVARLGGGEFAVIAHCRSLVGAESLGRRLQTEIARPFRYLGKTCHGKFSIGIHFDGNHMPLETRLHKAEQALSQAKYDAGNCLRVFSEPLEHQMVRRRYLEELVATGLAENRFWVAFQPLVEPATGCCAGFEALLRLDARDGRPVAPEEFIPVAERTDLINEIGAWVLERAVENALSWPDSLSVAVNLSVRQFESGQLVSQVHDLLQKTGLPASRLELEVTESLLIDIADGVGDQLKQLRALGISIAMDDFGTGYSSLGYLWQFGFDRLKIDRSFISGISANPDKAHDIIGTIIALGHRLDMRVTAEGIETAAEAELLSDLACDLFQGYYFGRPMPERELAAFLNNRPPFVPSSNAFSRLPQSLRLA